MIDFAQNYFELFGVAPSFQIDQAVVTDRYRQLQRELHPDRFANQGAEEQRLSVQFTSHINTAYQTLKSPLLRAEYLLSLVGHPVNSDSLTISDHDFLFKQMEWREVLSELPGGLESIDVQSKLDHLALEVNNERQQFLVQFEEMYKHQQYKQAMTLVAKLHFVEKMLTEIERLEESLFE